RTARGSFLRLQCQVLPGVLELTPLRAFRPLQASPRETPKVLPVVYLRAAARSARGRRRPPARRRRRRGAFSQSRLPSHDASCRVSANERAGRRMASSTPNAITAGMNAHISLSTVNQVAAAQQKLMKVSASAPSSEPERRRLRSERLAGFSY